MAAAGATTVSELFAAAVAAHEDEPALRTPDGAVAWTWGGLSDRMRVISYMPMAHIAEHLVTHYLPIAHGWRVTTCGDARAVGTLLPDIHPEACFSPPRMWEKLRASALAHFDGGLSPTVAARDGVLARYGLDAVRVAIVGALDVTGEVDPGRLRVTDGLVGQPHATTTGDPPRWIVLLERALAGSGVSNVDALEVAGESEAPEPLLGCLR